MPQSNSDLLQITKKNVLHMVLFILLITVNGCFSNESSSDQRKWCFQKVDSLWLTLTKTRQNFKYSMDEIALRKESMEEEIEMLSKLDGNRLAEADKQLVLQYIAIFNIYKPLAGAYKNTILKTEDIFFQVKALEKSVKSGLYDTELEDFKTTWSHLEGELNTELSNSQTMADQLTSVEPLFVRLNPKIEDLMNKLGME